MRIDTTYVDVYSRYPEQALDLVVKMGRCLKTLEDAASFKWSFEWSIRIEAMSFQDLINTAKNPPPSQTLEEELRDYESRCRVVLRACKGKCIRTTPLESVPHEILDMKRRDLEARAQEKARFESLTPEEQATEEAEAISDFLKGGGVMFRL